MTYSILHRHVSENDDVEEEEHSFIEWYLPSSKILYNTFQLSDIHFQMPQSSAFLFTHTTSSFFRSSTQKNLLKFDRFIHSRFTFFRFSSILEFYVRDYDDDVIEAVFCEPYSHQRPNCRTSNLGSCEPLCIKSRIAQHSMKPRSNPLNRATLDGNSIKQIWGCASIFTWKTELHDTPSITYCIV